MPRSRRRNGPDPPSRAAATPVASRMVLPPVPPPPEAVGDWRLPNELRRFFRTRTAQSLLIRGAPGTGKTTLALSLLAGLPIPGFYVSTRVYYNELLDHFPWITERLAEDHVVDAEALWPGVEGRRDYAKLIRKFTHLSPDMEEFSELDRFLALPTGVQEVFSRFPAGERSALVIDSWDGLIEPYLGHPSEEPTSAFRSRIENALVSVLARANVHAIMIRESAVPSSLEYLVHGVVELRRDDREGIVLRELHFQKLRGVPLQASSLLYSLDGGRFTAIPRSLPSTEFSSEERFQLRENPTNGLSWGIGELDRLMGPLRSGQPVLLEIDPQVDRTNLRPITFHLYAQALRSGWEVAVVPDPITPPATLLREMEQMVESAVLRDHCAAIPGPAIVAPGTPTPAVTRQLVERVRDALTGRALVRVALNAFAPAFAEGSEYVEAMMGLASRVRDRGGILLFTAPTGTPGLDEIVSVTHAHIRIGLSHRSVLIYGVRPASPALGMLANLSRGEFPAIRLIPIR
jgi:KaiC/GvpD/RAD55 family RecA-like ATPase